MTALKKEVIYAMTCQAGLPDGDDVYLTKKSIKQFIGKPMFAFKHKSLIKVTHPISGIFNQECSSALPLSTIIFNFFPTRDGLRRGFRPRMALSP